MKILKVLLCIFVSFIFVQNVYAAETVSIESVDFDSKSSTAEIVNPASYEGLSIKFDVKFNQLYDYVKYVVVVDNPTEQDYEISENSNFDDSEYVTYEFTYDDGNNIVEKNKKTTMYITIKYAAEVPASSFTEGSYSKTNNLVISLGNDIIDVPDTFMFSGYFFIVILILGLSIMIIAEIKNKKSLTLLIIGLIFIPSLAAFAIEKLQINVESKVEIEEMPVCNAFATDDWKTISKNVKLNNTECYHVGDTKEVSITGLGAHEVRISNMSTLEECSGEGFSQTACGFVLEFTDIIENRMMNDTKTSEGGFKDSMMRSYLNEDFYEALPEELQNVIIETKVFSGSESSSVQNYETEDKIYLLASKEIMNNNSNYNDYLSDTRQLDYYNQNGTGTATPNAAFKKLNNTNKPWWTRSCSRAFYNYYFTVVYEGGSTLYYSKEANQEVGVSPAFRLG